ncbi:hypothetical protein N9283_01320 [Akkermansiaceae bacterium]|nr:hypothetical protein [Akkermansiaceae bacterium]MDB4546714.1 hypothetical protein [Akkermansiaceae bacterium]
MKLTTIAILALTGMSAQAVVLFSDDFDTNVGGPAVAGGMTATLIDSTTVPALGAGRGNVQEIDISTGGQWGSFNIAGGGGAANAIPLPAGTIAGTDTYTISMDVFIPTTTTADTGDSVSVIMRLNGTTPDYFPGGAVRNSAFLTNAANQGSWLTVSNTITIPEFDNIAGGGFGTDPVVSLLPIFSIRDADNDTVLAGFQEGDAGVFAYIDNLSLSVTESIPEPSSTLLGLLGAAVAFRRRR